jgi:acetyltransferase-like isoleucine patch superfamily enzyme
LAIHELNLSIYCFEAKWLWGALKRVKVSAKGEYYLTDVVAIAREDGLSVKAIVLPDFSEAIGINTRVHLAEAEAILRQRINRQWMEFGVTLTDPASTYIGPSVKIGRDTTIGPNTHLRGNTVIGEETEIGPNCIIEDSTIGSHCKILAAVIEKAVVEDNVSMGPFAHLRKGAHLMKGVHMGNFGEVKDSTLHPGVKMGHFSYIGNADIGDDTNIGAGTITCNFDGVHKNPTVIGKNVFIGSDTMLVAPLNIGENARTGAGSVVTHDVPAGEVVVGVPARPHHKKVRKVVEYFCIGIILLLGADFLVSAALAAESSASVYSVSDPQEKSESVISLTKGADETVYALHISRSFLYFFLSALIVGWLISENVMIWWSVVLTAVVGAALVNLMEVITTSWSDVNHISGWRGFNCEPGCFVLFQTSGDI